MANYMCAIRSNYFHVNDKEKFEEFMAKVYGSEDNVEFWTIDGLQSFLAEGDAIIISQAGAEKLRYVVGLAEIITKNDYKVVTIKDESMRVARELLGNAEWATRNEY